MIFKEFGWERLSTETGQIEIEQFRSELFQSIPPVVPPSISLSIRAQDNSALSQLDGCSSFVMGSDDLEPTEDIIAGNSDTDASEVNDRFIGVQRMKTLVASVQRIFQLLVYI